MAQGDPWLSVVMPVFNGAKTLEASLASLCGQDADLDIILIDQGSTDDSVEIARRYEGRLALRIFIKPEHTNWVQNTNYGLAQARAARVAMLHQDDIWMPGRAALLRQLHRMSPDAALWVHAASYIDGNGRRVGTIGPPFGARQRALSPDEALQKLIVQNTIALPAAMFRTRDAQLANGLDEDLWYTADWDLWLRLAGKGPLAWSPAEAVGFRLHRQSQTLTGSRDAEEFARQLAVPIARHSQGLSDRLITRAELSNRVNAWLAARYHGAPAPIYPMIRDLLISGPGQLYGLMRDSRLPQRISARLRTRL